MMPLLLRHFLRFIFLTLSVAVVLYFLANYLLQSSIRQTVEAPNLAVFRALEAKLLQHPSQDWLRIVQNLQPVTGSTLSVLPEKEISLSRREMQQLQQGKPVTTLTDTAYYFGYGLSEASTYWQIGQSRQVLKITGMPMQSLVQHISSWMTHLMQLDLDQTPSEHWPEKIQKMQKLYQLPLVVVPRTNSSIPETIKQQLAEQEVVLGAANSRGNIETVYVKLHSRPFILKIGPIPYPLLSPQYNQYLLIGVLLILVVTWIIAATLLFSRSLNKIYGLTAQYSQGDFSTSLTIKRHSSLYPLYCHLMSMGKQLQQLIEGQQNLTRFIAHDCRTPIATMLFAVHALEQEMLSDKANVQINSIKEDLSELNQLVDDLLNYARVSAKEFRLNLQKININDWLRSCVDKCGCVQQNIFLRINLPENYTFCFDAVLMKQALSNLINNAIKHGGARVEVAAVHDVNNLIIQVEDDGAAIGDDDKDRIFQPFIQLNNDTRTEQSGFGLGLAIAQTIVKHHGGEIKVSDAALGGACFAVVLPMT